VTEREYTPTELKKEPRKSDHRGTKQYGQHPAGSHLFITEKSKDSNTCRRNNIKKK
jgi:hypothetical protein